MNAYMEEWAVLLGHPTEKYNTSDSSAFAWESTWPRIADWYGIKYNGPQDGDKYTENELPFVPRGFGPKGVIRRKFRLTDWANRHNVKEAWRQLAGEYLLP